MCASELFAIYTNVLNHNIWLQCIH